MQTTQYKCPTRGQMAETVIDLGRTNEAEEGRSFQLQITTMKRSNGQLATTASVVLVNGRGSVLSRVYQDYYNTLARESVRCTAKAVQAQHEQALTLVDKLKIDIDRYYSTPAYVAQYGSAWA